LVENRVVTLLEAIDRQDADALVEMLVDDVVFHSPVQTYRGRDQVLRLLTTIGGVIENLEVTRRLEDVTFFAATVEEHPVDGVLVEREVDEGRIAEITLMLRPLAQLQAAVARMARALAEGTGAARADVWVRVGDELRAEAVWPPDADRPEPLIASANNEGTLSSSSMREPVRHQGELLGALSITKKPGESITATEEKLVRDLAAHFRMRIEMRQIGVRDEAKLLADYGDCGKPVCCNTHMVVMPPVSMRMAKLQKSTLDPTKISGRCGRLKCCLRFEQDVYEEFQKELPPVGSRVVTDKGQGRVLAVEVLARRLLVEFEDGRRLPVAADEVLTKL